jgi:guanine nucleotide-binding protein subunit gamma
MNARPHKQSMSELKLRRLTEHNQRLREDLARPRMRVSEASSRCVRARLFPRRLSPTRPQPDPLLQNDKRPSGASCLRLPARRLTALQVPSVWGPVGKGEDPYAPPQTGCNCVVM